MKKIIVLVTAFLLTLNIASASVLNYYGKIKGTADVEGPTFYAYPESIEDHRLYKLGINEPPTSSGEISFTDGGIIGFTTDPLGITSFYSATYSFYVNAKVDSPSRNMSLELWALDIDDDYKEKICDTKVTIDSSDYKIYEASCSAGSLALVESDSLYWKIYGLTATSVGYSVMIDGDMRIEIEALS